MPVFKLCMKIIRKNLPSMMIYVVIFLGIAILITTASTRSSSAGEFTQTKTNIAFFSGENTPLVQGLKKELSKTCNFVELPDETEKLQDALFFRSVSYIIRIPKGFTESFLNGGSATIGKTIVPDSVSARYTDLAVSQYLNIARLYVKNLNGISQEKLVNDVENDFSTDTPVELQASAQTASQNDFAVYYFNYLAYTLSAVLILGIAAIMLVFNNLDLKRRNYCSPLSAGSMNVQFILANFVFAMACWIIMVGACFVLNPDALSRPNTLWMVLNSLVLTLCLSGMSYLIGSLMKSRNAISAVCNVVTLGPCFISGVFVPQEFLNGTVLKIASFTPTYWYVKANNQIADLTSFSYSVLSPTLFCMMVELGFAAAFLAIALAVGKNRKRES